VIALGPYGVSLRTIRYGTAVMISLREVRCVFGADRPTEIGDASRSRAALYIKAPAVLVNVFSRRLKQIYALD
jgi:hypothetical protein